MNVGDLNTRIHLYENKGTTKNSHGETVESWQKLASVWAKRTAINLGETLDSERIVNTDAADYIIVTRPKLSNNLRVKHGTLMYDVRSVDESKDKLFVTLHCTVINE